jgi:hypothetical protein
MARLDELPREIISLVCSLLEQPAKYHCSFVNKEFYDAAIPELWREPVLPTTNILKQLVKCLKLSKSQRGDYIRIIKLGLKVSMNDDELVNLLQLVPNLEVLELRKADELTDKSMTQVSHYCNQLKSFGVTGALLTYRSAHYLGRCRQLSKLTLESCPNLSSLALLPFAELNIEYLDLSGCKWLNVTDTAYDLCSFQYLTHLNLVCCDVISMEFIRCLAAGINGKPCLTNLQDFSITGSTIIKDSAMIPFIKTHSHIRGLFLVECAITDETLEAIASYLPLLHNLELSFCSRLTSRGVRHLINKCNHLTLLGLKNCGMTHSDFPEIPSSVFSAKSKNYPHLDTLRCTELGYIRSNAHHQEQEESEPEASVEDDSVNSSYNLIQQYLNTEFD